jgi:hypothetical protein
MPVCLVDGVDVGAAKSGRLVHLGDLPKGVDPDHDVIAVPFDDFIRVTEGRISLRAAAEDMLAHHATLHPAKECQWAAVLERALRG